MLHRWNCPKSESDWKRTVDTSQKRKRESPPCGWGQIVARGSRERRALRRRRRPRDVAPLGARQVRSSGARSLPSFGLPLLALEKGSQDAASRSRDQKDGSNDASSAVRKAFPIEHTIPNRAERDCAKRGNRARGDMLSSSARALSLPRSKSVHFTSGFCRLRTGRFPFWRVHLYFRVLSVLVDSRGRVRRSARRARPAVSIRDSFLTRNLVVSSPIRTIDRSNDSSGPWLSRTLSIVLAKHRLSHSQTPT